MAQASFNLLRCLPDGSLASTICVPEAMKDFCTSSAELYQRIGYVLPWVGYAAVVHDQIVGGGAFVGAPQDNKVEIAYFTLAEQEGRGFATHTAQQLVAMAHMTRPGILVTAKTEPQVNASVHILQKLGFVHVGDTQDHEIGLAWAWTLAK
jgi:[ribosomal protein S5]-alanine N-acetyltransferase